MSWFVFSPMNLFLDIKELIYYIKPGVTPTACFCETSQEQNSSILSTKYEHFVFHPSLVEYPEPFLGYYSCGESSVVLVALSLPAVIEQLI